jgi:hypothetical protein
MTVLIVDILTHLNKFKLTPYVNFDGLNYRELFIYEYLLSMMGNIHSFEIAEPFIE